MFSFGASSKAELKGLHPDLITLCYEALKVSRVDFRILQGMRTREEQIEAFETGHSKIDPRIGKVGRHQVGCAIDFMVFVDGKFTFNNVNAYAQVRAAFRTASKSLKIPIRTLEKQGDLGHIELLKSVYSNDWNRK